jgi:hypothetical protein
MIKRCLYYSFFVLKWNIVLSPVATFFAISLSKSLPGKEVTINDIIYIFIVSFLTGGYLFGAMIYELSRSREYYYFYNLGISKVRLFLVTYALHLIISTAIILLVIYAKSFGG